MKELLTKKRKLITIGNLSVGKAWLDLGTSINLMPLSMLQRIGDVEVRPTRMTLQLADRSIKYPHGIVEDLLGDEVNFNIFEAMKHPNDKKDFFRVDVMDEVCLEAERKFSLAIPVEKALNFDMKAAGEKRKLQLHELEEMRLQAYESSKIYKSKVKSYHDRKIVQRNFQPG
uniref:Uncharacterized protein n=1 Tax=Cajanus cajan TaxID=3821 RepID=A0A151S5H6_CAJCA|nr:hypothetical protein KK1_028197 [Cajanus cajan]